MGDMPQTGRMIERWILIIGFFVNLGGMALGYGRLTQRVEDLDRRLERIERFIDSHQFHNGGQKL